MSIQSTYEPFFSVFGHRTNILAAVRERHAEIAGDESRKPSIFPSKIATLIAWITAVFVAHHTLPYQYTLAVLS